MAPDLWKSHPLVAPNTPHGAPSRDRLGAPLFSRESIRRRHSPIVDNPPTPDRKEAVSKIGAPRRTTKQKSPLRFIPIDKRQIQLTNRIFRANCCSLSLKLRSPEPKHPAQLPSPKQFDCDLHMYRIHFQASLLVHTNESAHPLMDPD